MMDWLELPFVWRSLVALVFLSFAAAPIGYFLQLRRMSLVGDALSHAVLPGAALGIMLGGFNAFAIVFGGLIAGLLVALLSGLISHFTQQTEDSSFAVFYLFCLAIGTLLISFQGPQFDLNQFLFGNLLSVETQHVYAIGFLSAAVGLVLYSLRRPLVIEAFDPSMLGSFKVTALQIRISFLSLVVLVLVCGFQILGTLLSLGLVIIPSATARLVAKTIPAGIGLSILFSLLASVSGLFLSLSFDLPSGPSIIASAGILYFIALLFSPRSGLVSQFLGSSHYEQ
jgi:zinc/manganese transport system permease protein